VTLRGGDGTHDVRLTADGQRIAAIRDRTIQVWDLSDPSRALTLYSPSPVHDFAFSPDGRRLVASSTDRAVRVWDVGRGLAPVLRVPGAAAPVAMNADGSAVAAFAPDRTIRVHRRGAGTVVLRDAPRRSALRMSANGQVVATFEGDEIAVWKVDGDGRPRVLTCGGVGDVRLSPDGRWLAATCGAHACLMQWDLKTRAVETVLLTRNGAPFAFSPDWHLVARVSAGSSGAARPITVWRFRTGTVTHRLQIPDAATLLQFSPDNSHLAVHANDGSFRVYRVAGGSPAPTALEGTPTGVADITFSPDSRLVANTSSDGTVRIQNVDGTGEPITLERSGPSIMALGFAPDGRDLVTLHNDGTVRHLPCDACAPISTVTALARERITRDFSTEERRKYLHHPAGG
jgi:WD40 repeat protein